MVSTPGKGSNAGTFREDGRRLSDKVAVSDERSHNGKSIVGTIAVTALTLMGSIGAILNNTANQPKPSSSFTPAHSNAKAVAPTDEKAPSAVKLLISSPFFGQILPVDNVNGLHFATISGTCDDLNDLMKKGKYLYISVGSDADNLRHIQEQPDISGSKWSIRVPIGSKNQVLTPSMKWTFTAVVADKGQDVSKAKDVKALPGYVASDFVSVRLDI